MQQVPCVPSYAISRNIVSVIFVGADQLMQIMLDVDLRFPMPGCNLYGDSLFCECFSIVMVP